VSSQTDLRALAIEGLDYFYRAGDAGDRKYVEAIRAILTRTEADEAATVGADAEKVHDAGLEFFNAPANIHPATLNLVARFASALAAKLAQAERKYGYSDGWASREWMDECRSKLLEHVAKGDPRDVAAYCAFLWHHGERTELTHPEDASAKGLACALTRAANYIDALGGDSKSYRIALAALPSPPKGESP